MTLILEGGARFYWRPLLPAGSPAPGVVQSWLFNWSGMRHAAQTSASPFHDLRLARVVVWLEPTLHVELTYKAGFAIPCTAESSEEDRRFPDSNHSGSSVRSRSYSRSM